MRPEVIRRSQPGRGGLRERSGSCAMSRIRMHLGVVLVGIGIAGLHLAAHATSVPFWGAHASVSIDTPIEQLRPGEM